MKKFAISLIALAAVSTAALASNDINGAERDSPDDFAIVQTNPSSNVDVKAFSTNLPDRPNYINPSQLR